MKRRRPPGFRPPGRFAADLITSRPSTAAAAATVSTRPDTPPPPHRGAPDPPIRPGRGSRRPGRKAAAEHLKPWKSTGQAGSDGRDPGAARRPPPAVTDRDLRWSAPERLIRLRFLLRLRVSAVSPGAHSARGLPDRPPGPVSSVMTLRILGRRVSRVTPSVFGITVPVL